MEEENSQPQEVQDQKYRRLNIPKLDWSVEKQKEAKISEETQNELLEIFKLFDKESTGSVNPNDLKEGLQIVGFHRECPEIFRVIEDLGFKYDKDKHPISFEDFINHLNLRLGDVSTRSAANKIFEKLVDQEVNQITPTKLQEIIEFCGNSLSQEDTNYLLKTIFAQNDDIDINQDEFYYIMTKKPSDIDKIVLVTKSK